jgi:hypothetical protein
MTKPLELDAIKARYRVAVPINQPAVRAALEDIPALVAEVERLAGDKQSLYVILGKIPELCGEVTRLRELARWCAKQSKADEGAIPAVVEDVIAGQSLTEAEALAEAIRRFIS